MRVFKLDLLVFTENGVNTRTRMLLFTIYPIESPVAT